MRTVSDGEAIRQLREAQGLGCTQLAAKAGLHRSFLDRIEKGERGGSAAIRLKIANALGVPLSQITYTVPSQRRTRQAA